MENRPLSELWRLVFNHYTMTDIKGNFGLCLAITSLFHVGIISPDEKTLLYDELRQEADLRLKSMQNYLWHSSDVQARIDFMNSRISFHTQTELPC